MEAAGVLQRQGCGSTASRSQPSHTHGANPNAQWNKRVHCLRQKEERRNEKTLENVVSKGSVMLQLTRPGLELMQKTRGMPSSTQMRCKMRCSLMQTGIESVG
ncbi:MAG: hypothetical protein ABJZ55_24215 [Fuerstiella sp.]